MAVKYEFSDHAIRRFNQRFRHLNHSIEFLVEQSIIFGGQKGSEYLLLNKENELVFPIVRIPNESKHIVKTVLTLAQAKANLSVLRNIQFEEDSNIAEKVKKIREKAEQESLAQNQTALANSNCIKISQENIIKLKILAEEFVKKYGYFPTGKEQKKVFREIKETLNVSNSNLNEYFLTEIGRLIRERNQKLWR